LAALAEQSSGAVDEEFFFRRMEAALRFRERVVAGSNA